jgi:hypothetical protein
VHWHEKNESYTQLDRVFSPSDIVVALFISTTGSRFPFDSFDHTILLDVNV